MNKEKNLFCLRCRIFVAKKFNVPPDNIDVEPIANCIERGIGGNTLILVPRNKREEKALCSFYGPFIIELMLEMIFLDNDLEDIDEEDNFQNEN